MNDLQREAFAEFVKGKCARLLGACAQITGSSLAVLGSKGEMILEVPGDPGDPGTTPASAGAGTELPIESCDGMLGVLVIRSPAVAPEPLLTAVADEIVGRFDLESDIQKMTEELLQTQDQLDLFYRCARILRPDEGLTRNAASLLQETAELLDRRLLILFLPQQAGTAWSQGPALECPPCLVQLTGDPALHQQIDADLASRLGEDDGESASTRYFGALDTDVGRIDYVVATLWVKWEYQGYVGLFKAERDPEFETGEIRLIETLGEEIANAATIQDINLELRQLLFNVVRSLVTAIEAKDDYTRGHSERIVRLCVQMGKRLELPTEEIQLLSWAAILHDIGKIAVQDGILNKPTGLTEAEFEIVKAHTEMGARMLEPITQLNAITPSIRHHHEHHDGTGYPEGLVGDAIPLFARIIAVADTYDAIVMGRPYRAAGSVKKAVEVIRDAAGSQFDPDIVRAFLDLAAEGALFEQLFDMTETPQR